MEKELDIFACIVALIKAYVDNSLDAVDDSKVENCLEEVVNNHGFMTGSDLLGDFNGFGFNASMLNMIIHSVYNSSLPYRLRYPGTVRFSGNNGRCRRLRRQLPAYVLYVHSR